MQNGPSAPIMGETTASSVIGVEAKEVEHGRRQGCWGQNRRWWPGRDPCGAERCAGRSFAACKVRATKAAYHTPPPKGRINLYPIAGPLRALRSREEVQVAQKLVMRRERQVSPALRHPEPREIRRTWPWTRPGEKGTRLRFVARLPLQDYARRFSSWPVSPAPPRCRSPLARREERTWSRA